MTDLNDVSREQLLADAQYLEEVGTTHPFVSRRGMYLRAAAILRGLVALGDCQDDLTWEGGFWYTENNDRPATTPWAALPPGGADHG